MKKAYKQPICETEFYHLNKALTDTTIGGGMATSNPQKGGEGEESWTKKENSSNSVWDTKDALGD